MFALFLDCCTKKYIRFKGRASRKEFWSFILFYSLILASLAIFSIPYIASKLAHPTIAAPCKKLTLIVYYVLFPPLLAVTSRRLHDRNLNSWWVFLMLLPTVGFVINLLFLIICADKGTTGHNRFGEDPQTKNTDH